MAEDEECADFDDTFTVDLEELDNDDFPEESGRNVCLCGRPVFEDNLIGCDGEKCTVEWYHYECVGIDEDSIPTGKWYCPSCTTENPEHIVVSAIKAKERNRSKSNATKRANTTVVDKGEKVRSLCHSLLISSLEKATTRKMFALSTIGIQAQKTAHHIIEHSEHLHKHSPKFCQIILPVINSGDKCTTVSSQHEQIWTSFHSLRLSNTFRDWWESVLLDCQQDGTGRHLTILGQYILRTVTEECIAIMLSSKAPVTPHILSIPQLTSMEENALRYVAGYIPHSLIKHFRKFPANATANQYMKILKSWNTNSDTAEDSNSFLDYTKKWTDRVNRGRLFLVKDCVYLFFKQVELVAKAYLTIARVNDLPYASHRQILLDKLLKSRSVELAWNNTLSDNCTNTSINNALFNKVLSQFMNVRMRAFVQAYLYIHADQVSKKGEKSLRKGLMD